MTPTVETTLAEHGVRIANLEEREKSTSEKLDSLLWWIMGTLAAAAGGLILQLLKK